MASFEVRGNSIRAIVSFPDGKRSRTFDTLREEKIWAAKIEHEKVFMRAFRHVVRQRDFPNIKQS